MLLDNNLFSGPGKLERKEKESRVKLATERIGFAIESEVAAHDMDLLLSLQSGPSPYFILLVK